MADGDFRRTDEGVVVEIGGEFLPLREEDAALIPDDVESGNLSDFGFTVVADEPETPAPSTGQEGQEQPGTKPPWWDDLRTATGGNLPAWGEVGMVEEKAEPTEETPFPEPRQVFDTSAFAKQLRDAQQAAETLGLVQEEQEDPGDFGSFEEAQSAAPAGYEPVYKGQGRWDFQRKEPEQTPTEFSSEDEAHDFAQQRGLAPGDYSLQWTGTGWGVTVDQVRGQRHTTFDDAQRNAPPGFRPTPRTINGATFWTYEKIPESPEQRFRSFDDLILRKFEDGDIDGAIAADRFRDMITRSPERISPRDFLGLAGQVMGLASDGQEFKEIMELVVGMTNQPITDPFAAEVQQAATAFDDALRGPATPQQEIDQALQGIRPGGGRQTEALQQAPGETFGGPPPPLEESEGTGMTRTQDDELVQEALAAARETVEGKSAADLTPEEWARFNATFETTKRTQRALGERQETRARQTSDPFDTPERRPQTRDPFSDLTDRLAETVGSRREPKRARTTTFRR